jgi:hypothetical protein
MNRSSTGWMSAVTRSMTRVSCVSMRAEALPSTSARWPVSSPMRMTSMAWDSSAPVLRIGIETREPPFLTIASAWVKACLQVHDS